jgi:hypothetical protein
MAYQMVAGGAGALDALAAGFTAALSACARRSPLAPPCSLWLAAVPTAHTASRREAAEAG